MKKTNLCAPSVPTAHIAVNKSRIKLYDKSGEMPTYYLQKGQEFQIELFNPTSDVILAKIHLNGKAISQGGLILNPGQRVFLDRYLDVAQKFLFDTYEVTNTSEVKKAIEDNGDIKIEFYKEQQYFSNPIINRPIWISQPYGTFTYTSNSGNLGSYNSGTDVKNLINCNSTGISGNLTTSNSSTSYSTNSLGNVASYCADISTSLSLDDKVKSIQPPVKRSKKTIETGRVEKGSHSNQEFEYVSKDFQYFPFHTVEYKLLPVSQKVNTLADVNVKRYCTNCGHKLGKTDKFCSSCGTKA